MWHYYVKFIECVIFLATLADSRDAVSWSACLPLWPRQKYIQQQLDGFQTGSKHPVTVQFLNS